MPSPPALPSVCFAEIVERYLPELPQGPLGEKALAAVADRQLLVLHALLARELAAAAVGNGGAEGRSALQEAEALSRIIARLNHGTEARANRKQQLAIAAAKARVKRKDEIKAPQRSPYHYDPAYEDWRANEIMSLPDWLFHDADGVKDETLFNDAVFGMPIWLGRAFRGYPEIKGRISPEYRDMRGLCRVLDWPVPPEPKFAPKI